MPAARFPLTGRRGGRAAAVLAAAVSLALTAGPVQAVAFPDRDGTPGPAVQALGRPVQGEDGKTSREIPADPTRKAAVRSLDPASWPSSGSKHIRVASTATGTPEKVGGLPVGLAVVKDRQKTAAPGDLTVEVMARGRAATTGAAVLLNVRNPAAATTATATAEKPGKVRLSVGYGAFAQAYGGSYGSRLALFEVPACALTKKLGSKECAGRPKPLASVNDSDTQTVSAPVSAQGAQGTVVALAATDASAQGSYKATPLAPSAEWNVSPSSGGFSWSYPIAIVPTPGGLAPSVGLSYSSQSVDGRTATTNNQGSWVGEGFSYEPGYIERSYKPCADDGHESSGEQCWAYDNATIMLNGSASQLVKNDDDGTWHLTGEDGSKVEKLTDATNGDDNGEHWKVTTTDGTEYYFGLNRRPGWTDGKTETDSTWTAPVFGDDDKEPCYDATFAKAWCQQAWRWNLDYVKDTQGNVMSYIYGKETNSYALNGKTDVNGTSYHRGGYLKRIEYGQRESDLFTRPAPARVVLDTAERCLTTDTFDCAADKWTSDNAGKWPDTPWDRYCKADTKCNATQASPSFWTRKRLTAVTTQAYTGDSTTPYTDVDSWSLTHRFTDNGDDSSTLWLSEIVHTGKAGDGADMKLPPVQLIGTKLENRVDEIGDNIAPLRRYRLATVVSESGSQLDISYKSADCAAGSLPKPGESVKRCYPVVWAPSGWLEPITDWFHKYVVDTVVERDRTGGDVNDVMTTSYDYQGDAAWRHAEPDGITDEKFLTWGQWQGYGKVKVTSGDNEYSTRVDHTYLQGMDGDKLPGGGTRSEKVTASNGTEYTGHKEFSGFEVETAAYDKGRVVSKVINTPWKHDTATETRSWGTTRATLVQTTQTRGYTAQSSGGWRETSSSTTYDPVFGRVLEIDNRGDTSTAKDNTCTRTSYADNASRHIHSLPQQIETVSVACDVTPNRKSDGKTPGDVVSDQRTLYDKGAFGDAPTKGLATATERLVSHDGTKGTYQTTGTTTYDDFGRPLDQTDLAGALTTTRYTDVNGLISSTKVTNDAGHITTTSYDPLRGQSTGQTDPNTKRTDLAFDALGRLTSVWLPDRRSTQTPSIKYSYLVRQDKPVAVKTEKIEQDGTYGVEYQLYDGLLRPRQKQTEGPNGARMVADTFYNATGNVKRANETYYAAGAPSDERLDVTNGDVANQTRYEYDGLGRATAEIFTIAGYEQWRTTTTYDGNATHTDPPPGGIATTSFTDAEGKVTELWHYKGDTPVPTGPASEHTVTKYTHTPAGELATVTDPKGNVWRQEYDQRGRLTKKTDPDAGTTWLTYDEADRLTSTEDARHKIVSTEYDKLGRPKTTWDGAVNTGTKLTETKYDRSGSLGYSHATYRYLPNGEAYSTVVQSFDTFYRPLTTNYTVPASEGALAGTYPYTTAYNRDGTVAGTGVPAAGGLPTESLKYTYDDLQRPLTMASATSTYVTGTVWSNTSQLLQLGLSTGGARTEENFYYEKGTDRLTRSTVKVGGTATVAKDAHYSYDQAGNVLSITDTANTSNLDVQCFAYDGQARLVDAWTPAATTATAEGQGTIGGTPDYTGKKPSACDAAPGANPLGGPSAYWTSWTVDDLGNRTNETNHDAGLNVAKNTTRTFFYGDGDQDGTPGEAGDGGPHQVTKVAEKTPTGDRQQTYSYGPSGNTDTRTIGGNTESLEWDSTGKLVKAKEQNGSETTFLYDAGGNRLKRKTADATTIYLPGTELELKTGATTPTATRYYSYAGQTIAVRTSDNKVSFLSADHHGTGELAVDATSGAVTQRRSDPYGAPRGKLTPENGKWPGEKGFVGGTLDASTGLTHLGAREYDPNLGKFISPDPVIDFTRPQQMNGYAYASNTPVTLSDPSGLYECRNGRSMNCDVHGNARGDGAWCPSANDPYCPGGSSEVGQAAQDVGDAEAQHSRAQQQVSSAAKVLVEIVKDILGINAAMDCISSGDLAACGETLLNIAGSFAGGLAGKLLAKYGTPWNWAKGIRLAKRVTGLLSDLFGGLKTMSKASERLNSARAALAKAREKALAAVDKIKSSVGGRKASACHSFLPDAEVLLANGKRKKIKDVKLGDKVLVTDPKTGRTVVREVAGTIVTEDDKDFVDLTIGRTGKNAHKALSALTATTTHPFWVVSQKRWIKAGALRPGMTLRAADGGTATVEKTRYFERRQRTHDLTVTGIHTYYVAAGNTPLLVHNCGLANNRSEAIQKIELKTASDRGVNPVTLSEGAGMDGLSEAVGGASDFKWAVTMDGELRVMPAYAGGESGGWPLAEMAHTVLAGLNGRLRAAGSGTIMDGFPAFITNQSGHFTPGAETLPTGVAAFQRAGIDVMSDVFKG
ncbi:RHS repeat-associated core domain-containing protein [Streptomyces olivochromogenes]|uniref:RHS repeat-associated core domain-containing protein n=1 Tax=Streptomyces olivochromogenes TaxID=1963 RepID=UPI0036DC3958